MEDNKDIEIVEQPVKKKRGRPRKVHPYEEFQPYIKETFANYLNDNYDMIYLFMNANKRIDKRFWNAIYEHVRTLNNKLYEEYSCGLNLMNIHIDQMYNGEVLMKFVKLNEKMQ